LKRLDSGDAFTPYDECMSFTNKNEKSFVLLYGDIEKCLRIVWKYGYLLENRFAGDWSYEETKFRTVLGEILAEAGSNSVVTNLGSQTLNAVRSLELYAGFKLGKFPNTASKEIELLKHQQLAPLFSLKSLFEKWIVKNGLSDSSAEKFSSAISPTLSKLVSFDIYSITDPVELDIVTEKLAADSNFIDLNKRGNQMYSGAIKHYKNFIISCIGASNSTNAIMPFHSEEPHGIRLYLSLLTKPFTILTGASGTGKTKLAESLAHYLGNAGQDNHRMVAVGADWTDNRNVLGFVNHLRDDGTAKKNPVYQSTPILDLLIDANETPETPFFLILDEMNLSHVERYFADFLSVMEQKEGGVFRLHTEGTGDNAESRLLRTSADKIGVPRNLPYPPNLFVIGTVNIDETTYMFSPKVLDRANVIEFKVTDKEIGGYLDDPKGYPEMVKAPDGCAESFLVLALKARKGDLDDLPPEVSGAVKEHLLTLFRMMEEDRFEFAYRTLNEVLRYLKISHELAEDKKAWIDVGWKTDLDAQILQKILPKLHGSIGRISGLVVNLADYCHRGMLPSVDAPGIAKLKEVATLDAKAAKGFPQSFKKLQAMAATLQSEQFVSFIR
jgi:hypothetical protein